jgi:hypothetical protein
VCPREFDPLLRGAAGGEWDAGHRHWLIERRRIGPVIRALQRVELIRCFVAEGWSWSGRITDATPPHHTLGRGETPMPDQYP